MEITITFQTIIRLGYNTYYLNLDHSDVIVYYKSLDILRSISSIIYKATKIFMQFSQAYKLLFWTVIYKNETIFQSKFVMDMH